MKIPQVCPKCFTEECYSHGAPEMALCICENGHIFKPLPVDYEPGEMELAHAQTAQTFEP